LATELTNNSITSADNTTRLLDNSDDNVTFTLSTSGGDNTTRTVYLHLLDFAGNTNTSNVISDNIFLMKDTQAPSNFDNFTIRDVGTTVDNASITNSPTVTLVLDAYDNKSGIAYVFTTVENPPTNAWSAIQNLDNNSYDNFTAYFNPVTIGSTSDNLSTVSYTFDNTTSGTKTVYAWVADGGKNIYISDNKSDSIYLDSVAPTIDNATVNGNASGDNQTATYGDNTTNAASGDAAYTDNRTVTITLGYTDNQSAVFQYYISENGTTGSASQYVDNVSGAISRMGNTLAWSTAINNPDNLTGDNLTQSVWSELDNDTIDNISGSGYYVTDNNTGGDPSGDNASTINYTFSSDGAKTLTISIKDAANNITSTTRSITVDRTPPARQSGATITVLDNDSGALSTDGPTGLPVTNSLTLKIASGSSAGQLGSLFQDALVGLQGMYITDDNSSMSSVSSNNFTASPSVAATFTVDNNTAGGAISSGDNFTVYVYALDTLGNGDNGTGEGYSEYVSKMLVFDNETPTLTDNLTVSATGIVNVDNNTFYTTADNVSFDNATVLNSKLTDNDNALAFIATTNTNYTADNISSSGSSWTASLENISLTANSSNTINVFAKDDAGNIGLVDTITVISDNTSPALDNITLVGTTSGNDNETYTDNATLKIVFGGASDSGSGLASYYAASSSNVADAAILAGKTSWNGTDNGTTILTNMDPATQKQIFVWVIDNASNIRGPVSDNISIVGDTSAPTLTSGVKINNLAPSSDNSTYANSTSVTVEINASDPQTGITGYYITEDNSTAPTSSSNTVTWKTDNITVGSTSISDNVSFTLSSTDATKTIYVYVKNAQDNVSVYSSSATDSIILDTTAPDDNGTARLTGSVASTSNQDNQTYTTTLSVALDNLSSWAQDNVSNAAVISGIYGYYLTGSDNWSTPPAADNSSLWETLDNLSLSLDNSSAWNGISGQILNSSNDVGNKTIYVWFRDNAYNVSDNYTPISIYFDNETPDWSGTGYTLFDSDNSSDNDTLNNLNTNSDNITVLDNLTAYDNESGVNGSGVAAYFFTDNQTIAEAVRDNTSGWQAAGSSYSVTLDNKTNRLVTIYGYVKDNAGNISAADNTTIAFDNATPVIDNLTLAPAGFQWSATDTGLGGLPKSGNVTLYLSASDNDSGTDNYSSGWQSFKYTYYISRPADGTTPMSSTTSGWLPIVDNLSVSSDNISFDNASIILDLTTLSGSTNVLDNSSSSTDNLTVVIELRDNASNVGNSTTIFNLNGTGIYYNQ
jgi:hypothetical protein